MLLRSIIIYPGQRSDTVPRLGGLETRNLVLIMQASVEFSPFLRESPSINLPFCGGIIISSLPPTPQSSASTCQLTLRFYPRFPPCISLQPSSLPAFFRRLWLLLGRRSTTDRAKAMVPRATRTDPRVIWGDVPQRNSHTRSLIFQIRLRRWCLNPRTMCSQARSLTGK